MKTMTKKEIKEFILSFINEDNLGQICDNDAETLEEFIENFDWRDGHFISENLSVTYGDKTFGFLPKENFQEVDHYGGEDQGSEYWTVYKITREGYADTYIKFDGYYDSWNGTEWHEHFNIVTPRKRMVEVTDWLLK